jgi:hypothetical protein
VIKKPIDPKPVEIQDPEYAEVRINERKVVVEAQFVNVAVEK